MEMRISLLQFEHLIDGKKPEARVGFAMFAPSCLSHTRNGVKECYRVVGAQTCRVCLYDGNRFALGRYDEVYVSIRGRGLRRMRF